MVQQFPSRKWHLMQDSSTARLCVTSSCVCFKLARSSKELTKCLPSCAVHSWLKCAATSRGLDSRLVADLSTRQPCHSHPSSCCLGVVRRTSIPPARTTSFGRHCLTTGIRKRVLETCCSFWQGVQCQQFCPSECERLKQCQWLKGSAAWISQIVEREAPRIPQNLESQRHKLALACNKCYFKKSPTQEYKKTIEDPFL